VERSAGWLRFESEIAHYALPDRLVQLGVLLLPVGTGLFATRLTSPLKLWDYLAVGRPIVAADTQALRDAAGDVPLWFAPTQPESLVQQIRQAQGLAAHESAARSRGHVRTWADRAVELDQFLDVVLP
jgi:hypothetical protein